MPKIHTIPSDDTINGNDKLLGSDGSPGALNVTKNYLVDDLKTYILDGFSGGGGNGGGASYVFKTVSVDGQDDIVASSSTDTLTFEGGTNITLTTDATSKTVTVAGPSLKTINNNSLIGSGNITISASANWGNIGGTLSTQTDLQTALDAKQDEITVTQSVGLDLDSSSTLTTVYNSTISDTVESIAVGGISAGTPASQLKSLNIVQVLDNILFPTILPSILTNKSVSLTISGSSGTLEIGSTVSRTLTASFNRGAIRNGDGTTNANPLVGAANQYTFTGTGISSTSQPGNTLSVSNTIVSGSNSWAVTVNHDPGTGDYFDNKGNVEDNLDSSRLGGTATDSASSPGVTGVYPYFYLKSSSPISSSSMAAAIQGGTATKVVASSTGTLSIPYNVSAEYLAVAYPATSTEKTKYFVTALDNGDITVVFNAVATESVTSSDNFWSNIDYKIHTSASALTNSNATIQLRNS